MKRDIIYHYGSLAGWPFILAKALRDQGHKSINIVPDTKDDGGVTNKNKSSNRQLRYDEVLCLKSDKKIKRLCKSLLLTLRFLRNAKIIHYHGATILPYDLDAFIFKIFGIPTVMSWGGGDARIVEKAASINPYFFRYQEPVRDAGIRKKLARLAKYGVTIATDPEMAIYMEGFFPSVQTFRAPIDISELTCVIPSAEVKKPKFMHIPTHAFVKGTVHIEHAFKKLQNEGYSFEPVILEPGFTQSEMRAKLSECDVYVDELRCGSYGYTALEATGSGKPTLTFIIDQIVPKFPEDLPFVNSNPDTVYDQIKALILDGELRHKIGLQSRSYVEKHHDAHVVAQDMLKLYDKLLSRV